MDDVDFAEFRQGLRGALFSFWPNNPAVGNDEIVNAVRRLAAEFKQLHGEWLDAPDKPGRYLFRLVGSQRTRYQEVFLHNGELSVVNNEGGPIVAKKMKRKWWRLPEPPPLPEGW